MSQSTIDISSKAEISNDNAEELKAFAAVITNGYSQDQRCVVAFRRCRVAIVGKSAHYVSKVDGEESRWGSG
jgi:hypothetical protein